jgi:predicted metal-dependent phosphoesterase TrpH
MKLLKSDLHTHSNEGHQERYIHYNAFTLIDKAMELGFEVLSITNHDSFTYNNYLRDYARERGIVLIPGIELTLKGKHVLIYNGGQKVNSIRDFKDLERVKGTDKLVVAPHPFFPSYKSLGRHLRKWNRVFDAIELSHFYTATCNFNKRAITSAKQFGLPMLGTSDSHALHQLNYTYTLIKSEKETEAIFEAIRKGGVEIVTAPLSPSHMARILQHLFLITVIAPLYDKTRNAYLYLTSLLTRS